MICILKKLGKWLSPALDKVDSGFTKLFNGIGSGFSVCIHEWKYRGFHASTLREDNWCAGTTRIVGDLVWEEHVCVRCGAVDQTGHKELRREKPTIWRPIGEYEKWVN